MKFGRVQDPSTVDFSLPDDHPGTEKVLAETDDAPLNVCVGCAKWNRSDLKDFYPDAVSDELKFYGTQFNSVELNATFYRNFSPDQIEKWRKKVPEGFKFFPKVNRYISHLKWLNDIDDAREEYIDRIVHFKEKLGTIFLQFRGNFRPKFMDRVGAFLDSWPHGLPLAIEFRHTDWFNDADASKELYALLEEHAVANVITDTAGRRDLLHMRLTNNEAFVRYVGANAPSDYDRLDDWIDRLQQWRDEGLSRIHFFIHQNKERASPVLAAHFIKRMNETMDTDLHIPQTEKDEQGKLF